MERYSVSIKKYIEKSSQRSFCEDNMAEIPKSELKDNYSINYMADYI